jgi:hypothetical protein
MFRKESVFLCKLYFLTVFWCFHRKSSRSSECRKAMICCTQFKMKYLQRSSTSVGRSAEWTKEICPSVSHSFHLFKQSTMFLAKHAIPISMSWIFLCMYSSLWCFFPELCCCKNACILFCDTFICMNVIMHVRKTYFMPVIKYFVLAQGRHGFIFENSILSLKQGALSNALWIEIDIFMPIIKYMFLFVTMNIFFILWTFIFVIWTIFKSFKYYSSTKHFKFKPNLKIAWNNFFSSMNLFEFKLF